MNIRRVPWTDIIISVIGIGLCLLMLTGCYQSRTDTERVEIERVRGIQAGQPVDLTTTRQSQETDKTQAGADPAAIAAAVSASVKAAIPGADAVAQAVRAFIPPAADLAPLRADLAALAPMAQQVQALASKPAPSADHTGELVGAGGTALALLTAYLQKRRADEHAADAAEGWDQAKAHQERAEQYALQLPPKV